MFCSKTPHKSEKDATRHMLHQMRRNGHKSGGTVRVYCCDVCGYWHFGHVYDGGIKRKVGKQFVRQCTSEKP